MDKRNVKRDLIYYYIHIPIILAFIFYMKAGYPFRIYSSRAISVVIFMILCGVLFPITRSTTRAEVKIILLTGLVMSILSAITLYLLHTYA